MHEMMHYLNIEKSASSGASHAAADHWAVPQHILLACCTVELCTALQVSSVAMLSSTDLQPLEEYKQMPPSIRWQTSPDRSVLKVWLPPERKQKSMEQQQGADAAGGRQAGLQCTGLDFTVALQQGQAHAMG